MTRGKQPVVTVYRSGGLWIWRAELGAETGRGECDTEAEATEAAWDWVLLRRSADLVERVLAGTAG